MSPATLTPPMTGSIVPLMDALVEAANSINDTQGLTGSEALHVHRWKPLQAPESVALWHWMTEPPPPELKDQNRLRDHLTISAFIGMRRGDQDADLAQMERYFDAYRIAIDPLLYRPEPGVGPLSGTARWAERKGPRLVSVTFGGGIELMAFEFPLQVDVDRPLLVTTTT